jgi:hypothetical protein
MSHLNLQYDVGEYRFSMCDSISMLGDCERCYKSEYANPTFSGQPALPENFGDLTELWYLDIGLRGQDIKRLPESIGNLFNYSIYELVDRNGLPIWEEMWQPWPNYEECKNQYNNLKYWPDPEFDRNQLKDYNNNCGVYLVNIHIDGNNYLGAPDGIPESIANWSKLQMIFNGIGIELPDMVDFQWPDVFDHMSDLLAIQPTQNSNDIGLPVSSCLVIPNFINFDYMNNLIPTIWENHFGQTINPEICLDVWDGIEPPIHPLTKKKKPPQPK